MALVLLLSVWQVSHSEWTAGRPRRHRRQRRQHRSSNGKASGSL